MSRQNDIIYVDGTVGVGKTTLLNILRDEGFIVVPEPYLTNPVLEKYFADKSRYALASQVYFLNKKFELIQEFRHNKNCIIDRSIYGDYIFAKMLVEDGTLSKEEFQIYNELYNTFVKQLPTPKLIIHLSISLDQVLERIQKRGRSYEQTVDIEYWAKLNTYYQEFARTCSYPILNIEVDDLDVENDPKDRAKVIGMIKSRLEQLS